LHDQELGSLGNASTGTLPKSFFARSDLSPTLERVKMGTAAVQGKLWGTSPRNWADYQEVFFTPIYNAILDRSGITAGSAGLRVLDVGCGAGLFCALAAKRGATVSGLDAAEALLDVARKRTPSGDFRQGEMEELPFADGTFDIVTGFNSFQYAADPVNALRQARRVSKPSAKVSMAVWGLAKDCQSAVVVKAMGILLPPPPPGASGPFALSEPGVLEDMLSKAGLKAGKPEDVDTPFDFTTEDEACRGFASSGPGVRAADLAGEEKLRAALLSAIAPFKTMSGRVHMDNKFRFVVAES
jgi:SAM-dependent methyltransferase